MAAANKRMINNGGNETICQYEGKVDLLESKRPSKYARMAPEGVRPQQQNVKSGKVFFVGRRDVVTAEDEEETSELEIAQTRTRRPRKSSRKHSSSYIEEDIEQGETVQSLAIRYSCTVSEIRRLNNLYSDLDFHALTKVKIPVKANSLLTEAAEQEKRRKMAKERSARETDNQSSTESENFRRIQVPIMSDEGCEADEETVAEDEDDREDVDERERLLARIDSKTPNFKAAFKWKDPMKVVFKRLDEDLQKMREKNDSMTASKYSNSYDGEVRLPMPIVKPMVVSDDPLQHNFVCKLVVVISVIGVIGLILLVIVLSILH